MEQHVKQEITAGTSSGQRCSIILKLMILVLVVRSITSCEKEKPVAVPVLGMPSVTSAIPDTTVSETTLSIQNYRDLDVVFRGHDGGPLQFDPPSTDGDFGLGVELDDEHFLDLSIPTDAVGTSNVFLLAKGEGGGETADTFAVTVNVAPTQGGQPQSPPDGATDQSLSGLVLTWSAGVDPEGDELLYTVELQRTGSAPSVLATDIHETSIQINGLECNIDYGWRVETSDGYNRLRSGFRTFKTRADRQPVLLGSLVDVVVDDVAVAGTTAFVVGSGYGPDGFRVIDISNPSSPTEIGSIGSLRGQRVAVSSNLAIVCSGPTLRVVNVSSPASPAVKGSTTLLADGLSLDFLGFYVFAGSSGGLQVIDVSDEANPFVVKTVSGPAYDLELVNSYAVVAAGNNGIFVYDVSIATDPREVGNLPVPAVWAGYRAESVAIANGKGLVVLRKPVTLNQCPIDATIIVVDFSDPVHPTEIVTEQPIAPDSFVGNVDGYQTTFAVAAVTLCRGPCCGFLLADIELRAFDLTSPTRPCVVAASYDTIVKYDALVNSPSRALVTRDFVFITYEPDSPTHAGLEIYDRHSFE